ncbi:MAG: AAA family ATPase [Actinobacteria bacterium]|nr:AAA family ATPase [Actinomycetota bacterium]
MADPGTMVGRQPELSRLRAIWQEVRKGSTRLVLVAGEPGVGKTRLAAELAGTAEADGARVLVGRCLRDGEVPYGPFVEALGPALSRKSETWLRAHVKRHGAGLIRLFPELTPRLDQDLAVPRSNSRSHLFGSVAAAIHDLDGRKPLLLVLEDLHWATRSTALLLEHIVRENAGAPLLIVGTYRDAAIHPSHPLAEALDRLGSDPHVERLVLANLSPQAVTALLVDRAAVAGRAAAALALELWRTTEGHPLVLTEFVRDLVGHGALADGTVSAEIIDQVGIPDDIIDLVGRRMGKPGTVNRTAMEAASVVGLSFPSSLVAAVTEQKEDDVRSALRQAAEASIIVPSGDPPKPSAMPARRDGRRWTSSLSRRPPASSDRRSPSSEGTGAPRLASTC